MKKLLLFLICIMPFLGIGQAEASSEEPVKKVVLVNVPTGETVTTQRIDASDKLGATYVDYMDPIIVGEETRNGVAGYNVKTFHTGTVEMMIFPVFE